MLSNYAYNATMSAATSNWLYAIYLYYGSKSNLTTCYNSFCGWYTNKTINKILKQSKLWIVMVAKWLLIDGWWYFRLLINDGLLEFYSLWEIHMFWFPQETFYQNSLQRVCSKHNYLCYSNNTSHTSWQCFLCHGYIG